MKRYSVEGDERETPQGDYVLFTEHCLDVQRLLDAAMELKRQIAHMETENSRLVGEVMEANKFIREYSDKMAALLGLPSYSQAVGEPSSGRRP